MKKYMLVAEVDRGQGDRWPTMYFCGRGYIQWTYDRNDAKVWERRAYAVKKRDYFDRDIISWVRDPRLVTFDGFKISVQQLSVVGRTS